MTTNNEDHEEPKTGQGQLAFIAALPGALAYPFKGLGWAAIVAGAAFFYVMELIARFSILGWVLSLAIGGYLASFMIRILGASAAGQDDLPDWPSPTDFWDDLVRPLLLLLAAGVMSFLPAVIYILAVGLDWVNHPGLALALVALGILYLPMALVAVALYESIAGLNPVRVVMGILKTMPAYLLATAMLGGIYVLGGVAETYLAGSIPVIGSLVAGGVSLYAIMVEMRILGLLYLTHRKRLGWFE